VLVMLVGLAILVGLLVWAVAGVRRTGRHRRRAGRAADPASAEPDAPFPPAAPAPAIPWNAGAGGRYTDNFGSGYESSHTSQVYGEPAGRRDTRAEW